jgi:hypothetical protein
MSRFGWAYVSDLATGSSGTPGGSDKQIQFNSGSTFSGSTNFTFDYTTNTLYLTGTLRADTLIVSASQILKSGSTIFGDDVADTHQFTGSIYNTSLVSGTIARFTTITGSNLIAGIVTATSNIVSTGGILSSSTGVQTAGAITAGGILSSSTGVQTAGAITAGTNITSTGGTISASVGFQTAGTVTAANNITSTGGTISASVGFQTAGTITSANNITSTGGTISASVGFQTAGTLTAGSGIIVTGSSFVQALSSSAQIQATSFRGDGLNITGVLASNTIAAGNDWNIQFFNANTGYITGSNSLIISASSTPGLFLTQFSGSGIVKSSVVRSTNRTLNDGDYYLFFSSSSPLTATLGSSITGREVVLSNYGTAELLITGSGGVVGFVTTAGSNVTSVIIGPAGARTLKFVYLSNSGRWMAV